MEDRLLQAAQHLEKQLFEQFNAPYIEVAHNIVKAITRGGDPAYYSDDEIIDDMLPILNSQENEYTIQVDKLPYTIPYINFDVPNTDIDTLKNALGGTKDSQSKFFKRMQKFNEKYQELFDIDKEQWYKQYPKISYTLNKEGMRNTYSLDDLDENKFVPVFGDSNTFGMGLPVEDLWYNKLQLNLPIYNSSVISGSLLDAYLLLTSMYKVKKFKMAYVVIPHSERWNGVSDKGYHEGISNGEHYFLKQFENVGASLNQNTRQFYRWVATQALTSFCLLNDIELHLWDNNTFTTVKWCYEKDLHVPNWMFIFKHMIPKLKIANECNEDITKWHKHTARDFVHFGTEWHDKIADYMLTNNTI
jgi:hypothetical protein|tara:strand:+ start:31682 stop:32761 length:1080 start_codon:yes stop_codon:yes gene_type:complete